MQGIIMQVFLQITAFSLQTDGSGRQFWQKESLVFLRKTTNIWPKFTFFQKNERNVFDFD